MRRMRATRRKWSSSARRMGLPVWRPRWDWHCACCIVNMGRSCRGVIALMSAHPAGVVGLKDRGGLRVGSYGDVVVFDAGAEWKFAAKSRARSRRTRRSMGQRCWGGCGRRSARDGWCIGGNFQTRVIMTSVDFMRAAAVWPLRSCISRTASAVMMEVMRWARAGRRFQARPWPAGR